MTRVEYIVDYSAIALGAAPRIIAEDQERLSEYGTIVETKRTGEGEAIYTYIVEFEMQDGWDAYEQAHETLDTQRTQCCPRFCAIFEREGLTGEFLRLLAR